MTLYMPDPVRFSRMNTEELRKSFLLGEVFVRDALTMQYVESDRAVVGGAYPVKKELALPAWKELASHTFTERRELGILNIGGPGQVSVEGKPYPMHTKDMLYIGRGAKRIVFKSSRASHPAQYYFLSYPAHAQYPTEHAGIEDAEPVRLGSVEGANRRTLYKIIHPGGMKSCQLVMGFTEIEPGSVWNTMPPHTHARRMEIYLYFDMDPDTRVFHLMGLPSETRHVVVADRQAVISPSWSIHSGAGTGPYTFCWGMGGENQEFDDMDAAKTGELR